MLCALGLVVLFSTRSFFTGRFSGFNNFCSNGLRFVLLYPRSGFVAVLGFWELSYRFLFLPFRCLPCWFQACWPHLLGAHQYSLLAGVHRKLWKPIAETILALGLVIVYRFCIGRFSRSFLCSVHLDWFVACVATSLPSFSAFCLYIRIDFIALSLWSPILSARRVRDLRQVGYQLL